MRIGVCQSTLAACLLFTLSTALCSQEGPVKVQVKDGKVVTSASELAVDPNVSIKIGFGGGFRWGLMVDSKRITCSDSGSIWLQARVDGTETFVGDDGGGRVLAPKPLPAGGGKKRQGQMSVWNQNDLHFTQILEIVPGRPFGKPTPGMKRRMDTCLCRYIVENKSKVEKTVELRTGIDILINNNDGALFAAPTMFPGKVLNGIMLENKTLPEFVQVLERPDANNPGFFGVLTTKFAKMEGPNRVALTNLGAFGAWEVNVAPAGDAALAMYWPAKKLRPGEKREMVFAYGGGIASSPDNQGNVSIGLSGSFEPGKTFTVTAHVEDANPSHTLTLDLPEGMRRIEGKETQPVPEPIGDSSTSVVVWKASVERLGDFDLKVRGSDGVTQIKSLKITR